MFHSKMRSSSASTNSGASIMSSISASIPRSVHARSKSEKLTLNSLKRSALAAKKAGKPGVAAGVERVG